MFCVSCGRSLAENLKFCDGCGAEVGAMIGAPLGVQLKTEVKSRSTEAWKAIRLFALDPVGGLAQSYKLLGDDGRAIQVGITFAVFYEIAFLLGFWILRSKLSQAVDGPVASLMAQAVLPNVFGDLTAGQLFKLVVFGLVPFASLIGASALARAIFRGRGRFAGDVYTAGAVVIPTGLLVLVTAILGAANIEVILILLLFALTYSVLMLYAGCSRIAQIPEVGAAPAVPVILLASAWITKIMLSALW